MLKTEFEIYVHFSGFLLKPSTKELVYFSTWRMRSSGEMTNPENN